jgi:hypothetical protein
LLLTIQSANASYTINVNLGVVGNGSCGSGYSSSGGGVGFSGNGDCEGIGDDSNNSSGGGDDGSDDGGCSNSGGSGSVDGLPDGTTKKQLPADRTLMTLPKLLYEQ